MDEWEHPHRQPSLLTPAMRRLLLDEDYRDEISSAYASQLRSRTRERLVSGLMDMRILLHYLPDEELLRIQSEEITLSAEGGDSEADEITVDTVGKMSNGVSLYFSDVSGVAYRAGLAKERDDDWNTSDPERFERRGFHPPHAWANQHLANKIEIGVEDALVRQNEYVEADVSLNLTSSYSVDDDGELDLSELSESVLRRLLAGGEISSEAFSEEILSRRDRDVQDSADGGDG